MNASSISTLVFRHPGIPSTNTRPNLFIGDKGDNLPPPCCNFNMLPGLCNAAFLNTHYSHGPEKGQQKRDPQRSDPQRGAPLFAVIFKFDAGRNTRDAGFRRNKVRFFLRHNRYFNQSSLINSSWVSQLLTNKPITMGRSHISVPTIPPIWCDRRTDHPVPLSDPLPRRPAYHMQLFFPMQNRFGIPNIGLFRSEWELARYPLMHKNVCCRLTPRGFQPLEAYFKREMSLRLNIPPIHGLRLSLNNRPQTCCHSQIQGINGA